MGPVVSEKSPHTPESLRNQLVGLMPGLEIVMSRALGPGDDARDAVQEVVTRALHALQTGRFIRESLASFVHGIALHVVADVRRRRNVMPVSDADVEALAAPSANPLDVMISVQDRSVVGRALARLDDADRALLFRCFVRGERTSDIAEREGVPASRIRKRKSRAIEQLRALLNAPKSRRHTSNGEATKKE
jgi:RNA polymerase sigma factor (sigma-70 family)